MISKYDLKIEEQLFNFINFEVIPNTGINIDDFWNNFSNLVSDLTPINRDLLKKRVKMQKQLNAWYEGKKGQVITSKECKEFLLDIDYLLEEGGDFLIDTENVDEEIADISGPQLVVPITNSRYAINAVNARWGSFYDALYGTDAIDDITKIKQYDPLRGAKVISYAKKHLDKIAPLHKVSWNQIIDIRREGKEIKFFLNSNSYTGLVDDKQIAGLIFDSKERIEELILVKNNLHCRVVVNPNSPIGKSDPANISDIILESAISSILDCEDSVSTVDAEDKLLAYRNWLGLMKGNLESEFIKNKQKINRVMNDDIEITTLSGKKKFLKGRSLMLIRNVGHLMTTPAILNKDDEEIGEGIMDGVITSLIAMHDLNKTEGRRNSLSNSIYIVKPKMHGPEEVSFTVLLFDKIEKMLKIPSNTIKIGIMDEERRTSVNLKECIRVAKSRVAFINTGFLDRTGDEIHTSMYAGAFLKKNEMKNSLWIKSYENRNVDIGLACGLQGKAQIGKGMWAMPDLMSLMIDQKISHPNAGANCAWVPSPTAATLHAMHYHFINVKKVQDKIKDNGLRNPIEDLLTLPLLDRKNLSKDEIKSEIENNAQGILGYVVKWVDQGIGCSKVPDINNIGLMEDRATCRISSQALSNWIKHEIVSEQDVLNSLKKMALVVDRQNADDPKYQPMSPGYNSIAFKAAKELVFKGLAQPSGYTEPILHAKRVEKKKLM
jgi:malate synthase